jgi:hypothetical protein
MMRKLTFFILIAFAYFGVLRISRELWGGIAAVAMGFLIIAVSIVFVAVFSKGYKNWPV